MPEWTPVALESPFAGDVERNIRYARQAYRDCLVNRGEAPFGSHLNYTQPGVLDDTIPAERTAGMEAGKALESLLTKSVFYIDRGFSGGMVWGLRAALDAGRSIEFRSMLPGSTVSVTLDVLHAVERFDLGEFLPRIMIVNRKR